MAPMRKVFLLACALALVAAGPGAQQAAARVSAETFASKPTMVRPAVSPSGRYVAAPIRRGNDRLILIVDLDAPQGTQPAGISVGNDLDVEWVVWKSDERLLAGLNKEVSDEDSISRVIAVDRDGKNLVPLFSNIARFKGNRDLTNIVNRLPNDPNAVLMGARQGIRSNADQAIGNPQETYNLYRVDVNTGRADVVQRGLRFTFRWLTDPQGVPRVRWDAQWDHGRIAIFIRKGDTDGWELLTQYSWFDLPPIEFQGFTNDPNIAIVASNANSDKYGLFEYNLAARSLGKALFQHPNFDVGHSIADELGGPIYDTTSGKFVGIFYVTDTWEHHYFDAGLEAIQRQLDQTFADAALVRPGSFSRDRSRMLVQTSGPKNPFTYFVFDAKQNTARRLGQAYRDIPEGELGDMMVVKYRSRDGTQLPGYLTLPPGKGDKKLPLVVMPHGGPKARDYVEYHPWVQLLANRGYAVFQPNFRGSAGYGRAFMEAGYKQWGRRVQDDIVDGVKALIADGTADPNRMCIFGWSFGGYAALAGGAFASDLYKCVIAGAGVSDLPAMVEEQAKRGTGSGIYQYWIEQIGDPRYDLDMMKAGSPALHAANFKAPVLLIHGDADRVVPIDQSKSMNAALKAAGKDVKFLVLPKVGHGPSREETRVTLLKELESFLAQHLGN